MTQHLEDELRDVFAQEARRIPADAGARLRARDYHPRAARIEPRLAIGALGGTAIAAGATAAVVGLGPSATPAFAGWTPAPTPQSPTTIAITRNACGKRLPAGAAPTLKTGPIGAPAPSVAAPPPSTRVASNWKPALTDTRGPYTFAIYTSGSDATMTCFNGPHFTMTSAMFSARSTSVAPDSVELMGPGPTARDGDPYTLADGRVGSDVRALTLVLADGERVRATIANGYFLAWWPGAQDLTSAEVETSAGTSIRPLSFPPPPAGAVEAGGAVSRASSTGSVSRSLSSGPPAAPKR